MFWNPGGFSSGFRSDVCLRGADEHCFQRWWIHSPADRSFSINVFSRALQTQVWGIDDTLLQLLHVFIVSGRRSLWCVRRYQEPKEPNAEERYRPFRRAHALTGHYLFIQLKWVAVGRLFWIRARFSLIVHSVVSQLSCPSLSPPSPSPPVPTPSYTHTCLDSG